MVPDERLVNAPVPNPESARAGVIPPRIGRPTSIATWIVVSVVVVLAVVVLASIGFAIWYYDQATGGSPHLTFPPGSWSLLRSDQVPSGSLGSGSLSFPIGDGVSHFLVAYWVNGTSLQLTETNQTGMQVDGSGWGASPSQESAGLLLGRASGSFGSTLVGTWSLSWTASASDLHLLVFTG